MNGGRKTKAQLLREVKHLRRRVAELEHAERKRQRAEQRIGEERKKLKTYIETMVDGFCLSDPDGTIVQVNRAFGEMFGYKSPKGMVGKTILENVARGERPRLRRRFTETVRKKEPRIRNLQVTCLRKDGSQFPAMLNIRNLWEDGRYTGSVATARDILQRKRPEKQVRPSEEKYSVLYETMRDGIVATDMDGNIIDCNQAYANMLGYSREEVKKLTYKQLMPKRWYRMEGKTVNEGLLKRGYSDEYEKEYMRKDGTVFPVSLRAWLVTDEQGQPTGIWRIVRDITERKRAEDRLQKELGAMAAVLNDMLRGEVDDKQTERQVLDACLAATDSVYGMIGKINEHGKYDTTTYSSQTLEDCAFPDAQTWDMSTGMTIRGIWGWPMVHDKPLLCNDLQAHPDRVGYPKGHVPLHCFLGVPLKQDDTAVGMVAVANKPGGYVQEDKDTLIRLASLINVSRQHRSALVAAKRTRAELEQLVAERTRQLSESEKRLQLMINSAHDVIFRLELDKGYTFMSPSVERLLGHRPEDYYSDPTHYGRITHPDDLPKVEQLIFSLKDGKEPPKTWELRQLHKDGHIVHLEFTLTAIRNNAGKIVALEGVARDITERKRAERKLKETLAALRRSNEELEQFAYVASHDLQEPLRMVSSYTQLLAERYKGKFDTDAEEFINFAVDGADRMQRLINDLLDYSRVTTRGQPFQPTDCSLVLGHALVDLEQRIEESHAIVTTDDLPIVVGDETQLARLFRNLIDNAMKFQGDERPHIHISARMGRGEWVFGVRDNGIGIDPQYRERIFVIFQRLHSRGEYPGTGIGLAVSRRIVERHGGRIWVKGEPGKGSTFHFSIPLREPKGGRI